MQAPLITLSGEYLLYKTIIMTILLTKNLGVARIDSEETLSTYIAVFCMCFWSTYVSYI